jgi:hypothetical protein
MTAPLSDAEVLTAARAADATTSALAREVAQARGLPIPLRITSIGVPAAADAPDYGPTGWSRHDDDHDGSTWYVRLPVELFTDEPAATAPAPGIGVLYTVDRDETIADVVCSLTCERDHDEVTWEIDNITIRAVYREVRIARKTFIKESGFWATVDTKTTRTLLDVGEVERALFAWAERERRNARRDVLAETLLSAAVGIVETPDLHDATVTL